MFSLSFFTFPLFVLIRPRLLDDSSSLLRERSPWILQMHVLFLGQAFTLSERP